MSVKFGVKPRITPLLQHELTRQLAKVTDALDYGHPLLAFRCLKTLIIESPLDVQEKSIPTLNRIEDEILEARKIRRVDLKQTRVVVKREINSILRRELRPLLHKVMCLLYEGNYLMADIMPGFAEGKPLIVE